jgi:hypothetical protein
MPVRVGAPISLPRFTFKVVVGLHCSWIDVFESHLRRLGSSWSLCLIYMARIATLPWVAAT